MIPKFTFIAFSFYLLTAYMEPSFAASKNGVSNNNFMQIYVPNMYHEMRIDPPMRRLSDDVVLLFAECVARKQYSYLSNKEQEVLEAYAKKFWDGKASIDDESKPEMVTAVSKLQNSWKPSSLNDLSALESFCPGGVLKIRQNIEQ